MKLLFNTYSANEYADGCEYAYLDLTEALARLVLSRSDLFDAAKMTDHSLAEMEFHDASAIFLDGVDESIENALGTGEDFEEIEAEPDLEKLAARTECDRMVITCDEVYWSAIPKHCDWRVETRPIPFGKIKEALK